MAFVLDASVAIAWCFEQEPGSALDLLHQRLETDLAPIVPSIWPLEVANAVLMAEKRRRIDGPGRVAALRQLEALEAEIDDEAGGLPLSVLAELALHHGLTVYDAAYLELALRRGLPLASLDSALVAAARAAGVETLL
ncbi:type II toxin-antitoxin system VapC family toxin [Ferrovibrio sp.]|uniref:type II toxin-antitoxin system VapC family toxin n=1 Tax=Ferrovibrio sp. TaxID=1917215 RepID=UPI0035B2D03E